MRISFRIRELPKAAQAEGPSTRGAPPLVASISAVCFAHARSELDQRPPPGRRSPLDQVGADSVGLGGGGISSGSLLLRVGRCWLVFPLSVQPRLRASDRGRGKLVWKRSTGCKNVLYSIRGLPADCPHPTPPSHPQPNCGFRIVFQMLSNGYLMVVQRLFCSFAMVFRIFSNCFPIEFRLCSYSFFVNILF